MDEYVRAGITDVRGFYREKFLTDARYDGFSAGQDFRHHVDLSKLHWVLANLMAVVSPGGRVLDVGCGCGALNMLQHAGYDLTGVDLSPLNCRQALANGYSRAVVADLTALPFGLGAFDAVVSMDVLGHVPFEQKDSALTEWKRVLRPGGFQLHGIECHPLDYGAMTPAQCSAFVAVDGHVGIEGRADNEFRFKRLFIHVASQYQFSLAMPKNEVLKQHELYPQMFSADPYLLNALRHFSDAEERAWNLAMGFVFKRIFDVAPEAMPDRWGFLLLRASDSPLTSDAVGLARLSRLLRPVRIGSPADAYHLHSGFHDREIEGHSGLGFRWTRGHAEILVPASHRYRLTIGSTRIPGVPPANWRLSLGGRVLGRQAGEVESEVVEAVVDAEHDGATVLTIDCDTFSPVDVGLSDSRALGVRVYALDWD